MRYEVFIPLLFFPLLFASLAHAQNEPPIVVEPVINIDLQGVIDAINSLNTQTNSNVNAVPTSVFDLFTGWVNNSLLGFNDLMVKMAEFLLTTNPNPDSLYNWWQSIVLIISSLYLLVFLLVGLMFLFSTISIETRVKAKEWLKGALFMIVGVNVSFYLYKLILELATAITQYMWVSGFEQFFQTSNYANPNTMFLVFYLFSIAFTAITLFARYLFLMAGVMLFPIAIFLYFIPPLKNWGQMIFNLIGIFLFMQFADVLVFIASNQIAIQLEGQEFSSIVPALAFLLVGIVNILLIIYAVLKSAFSIAENSTIIAYAFGSISGRIGNLANTLKPAPQPPPREGNAVH